MEKLIKFNPKTKGKQRSLDFRCYKEEDKEE